MAATGDPVFVCPFCGKMEYYATGCSCPGWMDQMAKLPKNTWMVDEQEYQDFSFCSKCGDPTLHMSFFEVPLCDNCKQRPDYEI